MFSSRLSYSFFWFGRRWGRYFFHSSVITLVYPYLDADNAVGRFRLGGTIVDIGTQRMQWHTAFAIPLGTRNFDSIQAARTHNLDALCAQTHGVLHGALHGTAEHDALFQLRGDAFRYQLRIHFRLAHFLDVQCHIGQSHTLAQLGAQRFDIFAFLADHHARTRGINRNLGILRRTLNDNLGNTGSCQLLLQIITYLDILEQHAGKILAIGIPLGSPVLLHAQPETDWMNFLSHIYPQFPTVIVMWQDCFSIGVPRPLALAICRAIEEALST